MNALLDDFEAERVSLHDLTDGLESEIESWGFHGTRRVCPGLEDFGGVSN
jgi:hypothetical protein